MNLLGWVLKVRIQIRFRSLYSCQNYLQWEYQNQIRRYAQQCKLSFRNISSIRINLGLFSKRNQYLKNIILHCNSKGWMHIWKSGYGRNKKKSCHQDGNQCLTFHWLLVILILSAGSLLRRLSLLGSSLIVTCYLVAELSENALSFTV